MQKNTTLPINATSYAEWLEKLLSEIDHQRLVAAMNLNAATLQHYWWMGHDILDKQQQFGWGAKVIDQLSADLQRHYGSDSGYSTRNLKYMRSFAAEYPDFPFVQVPLAQIGANPLLRSRLEQFTVTADGKFVQVPLAQITWYHHISLIARINDPILRAFYITETARQGWSRDIMLMQVESDYHIKAQPLPNNFSRTLPPVHSDLAVATFKDPYNLGFLDVAAIKREEDMEAQLTEKITDFLLEMGKGFAYVGRQFPINIGGDESRIDLLMYHTRLHCYVVVELKIVEFKPEFISKLNYYLSAVDDLVKAPEDNPTIGLLLCRTKNNTKVEYALRGMTQPLGVAEFETKHVFDKLNASLPSVNDLEQTLESIEREKQENE